MFTKKSLSDIHPDAKIAKDVVIEAFCSISKDVVIEEGTWVAANVVIMDGARIGKNCKIFPGAVISASPQDLKYNGEKTTAVVGDNTVIREGVTINKGTSDKYVTRVGKNCLIMAYVHIAHDCIVGDNVIIANNSLLAGHVEIGDFVNIGGATGVLQFAKIGNHAFIAGGSYVRKDVPPYTKAGKEPLCYCGINSVGMRRRNFSNEKIIEIQNIYRYVYLNGLNFSSALLLLEKEVSYSREREEIMDFIRNSKIGIMKGAL